MNFDNKRMTNLCFKVDHANYIKNRSRSPFNNGKETSLLSDKLNSSYNYY